MRTIITICAAAFFMVSCETTGKDEEQGGGERVEIEANEAVAAT